MNAASASRFARVIPYRLYCMRTKRSRARVSLDGQNLRIFIRKEEFNSYFCLE